MNKIDIAASLPLPQVEGESPPTEKTSLSNLANARALAAVAATAMANRNANAHDQRSPIVKNDKFMQQFSMMYSLEAKCALQEHKASLANGPFASTLVENTQVAKLLKKGADSPKVPMISDLIQVVGLDMLAKHTLENVLSLQKEGNLEGSGVASPGSLAETRADVAAHSRDLTAFLEPMMDSSTRTAPVTSECSLAGAFATRSVFSEPCVHDQQALSDKRRNSSSQQKQMDSSEGGAHRRRHCSTRFDLKLSKASDAKGKCSSGSQNKRLSTSSKKEGKASQTANISSPTKLKTRRGSHSQQPDTARRPSSSQQRRLAMTHAPMDSSDRTTTSKHRSRSQSRRLSTAAKEPARNRRSSSQPRKERSSSQQPRRLDFAEKPTIAKQRGSRCLDSAEKPTVMRQRSRVRRNLSVRIDSNACLGRLERPLQRSLTVNDCAGFATAEEPGQIQERRECRRLAPRCKSLLGCHKIQF